MPPWLRSLLDRLFPRPKPPVPIPPVPPHDPTRAEMVSALNRERTSRHLSLLAEAPKADAVAQQWAADMARRGVLAHGDFQHRISSVYPNAAAAENIAEGQETVNQVVTSWMNSPGHRANILGDYGLVGVGFARGSDSTMFWCVDFVRLV